ncbi:carboxypeptidase-like regulatory domain-containing protein [Tenacibaculum aquimarinum]|uniref:carboxypeptidase-like regulatory domain-containing protein n=1 Tax=Tenacibaculum aquimarinum TaxID=2910675 RepID=UPI001F0B6681|nr:carboxypeptidase-like regulatory domain-containing protein [Tenacibaculum aquimarinum]MCH3881579.1 carboxypeptidase-like regulatory domain-containing protein [Tenacibaculum aquimarinum]
MLKKLLLVIALIFSLFANAQNIKLKGTVKDSLQNPLSFANVIAKPKDVSQNLTFAITDEEGRFSLTLKKDNAYTISISYLGFEALNYVITPREDTTKNFVLKEAKNQLDEVVIELPISVKGDTTTYNTEHFVTGEERKLKNVLKKLPGVEVTKDGGVTVQGKKVTTMLVDGKKFFGGGTKLAVDNIPADAIDKVQVLDNYNEVAFLKNVSDSDEMAMNIQLKEDKKRFLFGDIEAGKGNKNYYKTHANLFYYSPKTNVNFIGNLNNTGEKTFTFKDYLSFSGGVNAVFNGNFNFRGGDFSQFLESNDLVSSRQRFGALNITKTTSDKLDVSGYVIFSHTNTQNFIETLNEYSSFTEQKTNENSQKNVLGIGKLSLEYAPNDTEQWYARTQIKKTNNYKNNSIISLVNGANNSILTDNTNGAWYINQNIEWHKKQSEKHTFSATANYTFDANNPTTFWNTTNPILQGLIPFDDTQNENRLQQLKENKKHHLHTVFKDFWVLNNSNHIYTTVGNTHQQEKFVNTDSQILDNGSHNNFTSAGFNNTTVFKHNDFFAGLHYKFKTGIFTFKQGAYLHNYNWQVNQQTQTDKNKWVVLPDFLMKIEFNKSKKIQVNYNLKSNFTDASKLANRFYLQSYNSVFKGNDNLENELYHSARIRYSRFSLYRGLMFNASANYSKKLNGFRNAVEFDGINQFLTIQLLENPSENWGFNSSIRKRIKKIRYKVSGRYTNSSYLQNVNNSFTTNKNENYSFDVGAETLFDNFPTIEVGFKRSIGNFTSNNSMSKFTTDEPYLNVDYDFLKGFIFNFDYTHYNYQNKVQGIENSYEIANTTLSYKNDDSAWSYKITAQNLFNTTFKQNNRFSDYLISDTKTHILPRIIMFSVGYNL